MMLGIALALPGHRIPPILRLGGLAARRTSSSAHRVSTSYKGAQLGARLSSVDRGATRRECYGRMSKPCRPMRPYISGRAAVASRPGVGAPSVRSAGLWTFVFKTLQSKTLYLTQARNIPFCDTSCRHTHSIIRNSLASQPHSPQSRVGTYTAVRCVIKLYCFLGCVWCGRFCHASRLGSCHTAES